MRSNGTRHGQLLRVHRAGRRELTGIKMKGVYANQTEIEICIPLQEFSERLSRDIAATCEGDVRVPRAKVGFQAGGERCFLDAFVNLKQVRVALTDANPNYLRRAFRRKRADAGNWKKKCAKLDRAEFFAQRKIDIFGDVPKETERKMHLVGLAPTDAMDVWVEIDKCGTR